MRSRRWLRPRAAVWRHQGESARGVTCEAPLAHLEGGSGRSKTSPTAILQGTHSLEGAAVFRLRYGGRPATGSGPYGKSLLHEHTFADRAGVLRGPGLFRASLG